MKVPACHCMSGLVLAIACSLQLSSLVVGAPAPPDAPAPASVVPALTCPFCQDYDECTVDSCDTTTGTCRHDPLNCDDGNPCTNDDRCDRHLGCRPVSLPAGTVCDDGKACTANDACDSAAHCVGTPLAAGDACDDDNPCTTSDTCDEAGVCSGAPQAPGTRCDDGNECTHDDVCAPDGTSGVVCTGAAQVCDDGDPCTEDRCDPQTGECLNDPVSCSDGNACTADFCDPATGDCGRTFVSGPCEDGDVCTVDDFCSDGNCTGGGPIDCGTPECGSAVCENTTLFCWILPDDRDCGGNSQCIRNYCDLNGQCVHDELSGTFCDDGNPCTEERCTRGYCEVQFYLDGVSCDDNNLCTVNDVCNGGGCGGTPKCDDGNACTDDLCDPATGACLGTSPTSCDDGNPCTDDVCDPAVGCQHLFNASPCDDHSACTTDDVCTNGVCRGTVAVTCADDGNPCTYDYCDAATGTCIHPPNNHTSCDDGDPCTFNGLCQDGVCLPGPPNTCNDNNPCTDDVCDPAVGCQHLFNTASCNDNNLCTTGDVCSGGVCRPGATVDCDDGNVCTTDGCYTWSGCYHLNNALPCEDGSLCTTGDACLNGSCQPGQLKSCIDGNVCTTDSCDPATGACRHESNSFPCSDGDACTSGDTCVDGVCRGTPSVNCDDGDVCTRDSCDPLTAACVHEPDPAVCGEVTDVTIEIGSPLGKGSGTVGWTTTHEVSLKGFDVIRLSSSGEAVRLNDTLIPCAECETGEGHTYVFIVPKHKSGKDVYVRMIGLNGEVLGTYGPAVKFQK